MTNTEERKFSDAEKSAEIDRELAMRERVYPRWVKDGRLSQADADKRTAIMREISAEYRDKAQGRLL